MFLVVVGAHPQMDNLPEVLQLMVVVVDIRQQTPNHHHQLIQTALVITKNSAVHMLMDQLIHTPRRLEEVEEVTHHQALNLVPLPLHMAEDFNQCLYITQ